jgi:hypothetical protein
VTTPTSRLRHVPAAVRPIVEAAVETVRAAAPEAEEIGYEMGRPRSRRMMWKLVRYRSGGENVLGIGTFDDHSTIFFYRGRELDDCSGLLNGSGKQSRFVTLGSAAEARSAAVKRLVRDAFRLATR